MDEKTRELQDEICQLEEKVRNVNSRIAEEDIHHQQYLQKKYLELDQLRQRVASDFALFQSGMKSWNEAWESKEHLRREIDQFEFRQ